MLQVFMTPLKNTPPALDAYPTDNLPLDQPTAILWLPPLYCILEEASPPLAITPPTMNVRKSD